MHSTPVNSLPIKKKQKTKRYDARIGRESSRVATSLLRQYPNYHDVNLPKQWFDKSDFNQRMKEYIQSISRNIRLKDHALELQGILEDWQNVGAPTTMPYQFSPQVITSHSQAPYYSLREILEFQTNILTPFPDEPFQCPSIFLTGSTEPIQSLASSRDLEILVNELRNSQQSLQKIYGDELNKSHCELLRQNVSQHARGVIPSHELLLIYHDDCSLRKDHIFSDISTALGPYQRVEKTNCVAGLWPRITPRTLLRQLTHDRIANLPDQWRSVITRYAASLLKYRHSLRLLELSSQQKHEELLREIETIQSDVLAESTPDWLLIQVRPLLPLSSR
jgi:hypothetical protein